MIALGATIMLFQLSLIMIVWLGLWIGNPDHSDATVYQDGEEVDA